jgi:23S rRNA pseudouridine1911/1915/1917 synthase
VTPDDPQAHQVTLQPEEGQEPVRLDQFLAEHLEISRSAAQDLIHNGRVSVDGTLAKKSHRVETGETIEVSPEAAWRTEQALPIAHIPVVYSDEDVVVIDKPAGVVVHPSPGWLGPSVVGSLEKAGFQLSRLGPEERPGVVHRLDAGTSGVMVLAISDRAYRHLKQAFHDREVGKVYHALVQGYPSPSSGTIDAPIGRHPSSSWKFAVTRDGKASITHYDTLEVFPGASLMEVHLETGRTHQIRVHFQAEHHPLVGDSLYGADPVFAQKLGIERPWLHAVSLGFSHPATKEWVEFRSDYPEDLRLSLERLEAS